MKTNSVKLEFGFGVGKDRLQLLISPEARDAGIEQIKAVASEYFGGYTLIPTQGGWRNDGNVLVEEPGYTLLVFAPLGTPDQKPANMITTIKSALRQEAVAFTQTAVNFQVI